MKNYTIKECVERSGIPYAVRGDRIHLLKEEEESEKYDELFRQLTVEEKKEALEGIGFEFN